ncbi:P-loop containing nucleoside triphosphate hydrolase [Glarea lozoyensis ATCC 20868]|uniref:RNA helicase n=1 Tax=Glarea lozoyensis (strain ATCC 20868 / MF5171) TaxID=1116229 RepID=S3EBQ8_GLAL2|nr:P-loop containing nucleoside triphosphate hydrolase [Glarea lozoyensis ATCC 20868]EPE35738.1 P-loop containing nucleoside triphosphate hydrolase [Glarea lozoyensis ATCC 20868]
MSSTVQKSGKCAICAFRASERFTVSRWQNGAKRHRTDSAPSPSPNHNYSFEVRRSPLRASNRRVGRYGTRRVDNGGREEAAGRGEAPASGSYGIFAGIVHEQVKRNRTRQLSNLEARATPQGRTKAELRQSRQNLVLQLDQFGDLVHEAARKAQAAGQVTQADNPLFFAFRQAFVKGHLSGLAEEVRYRFIVSALDKEEVRIQTETLPFQKAIADLTHPTEWFPATRAIQRVVHLHIGPTNSGKTYHALKRLEQAKSGIFAGPLRLLAHEVYTRFNAKGIKCALVTGEEHRVPDGMENFMNSCTVEMVPLNTMVDVCVIDEIQMLGDTERGWAWTNAFLGVQAKELHLCGEVRTEQLVRSLCKAMGEKLIIHRYERLGSLETQKNHVDQKNFKNLRKGDAVILFSRVAIHGVKKDIEKATGKRCAVVYGSLPPETRASQAALFNDPDNDYDFLVASNAVGMGLNLSIKRVIFSTTWKRNNDGLGQLETSEIKQIGGRAGRYKTAHSAIKQANVDNSNASVAVTAPAVTSKAATGFVTAFSKEDLDVITKAMRTDVEPMKTAGIMPPADIVMRFAAFFPPETAFSYVLLRLKELVKLNPHFHYCFNKDVAEILDLIQPYDMTLPDRVAFAAAPASLKNNPRTAATIVDYAKALSKRDGRDLLDFSSLDLDILDHDIHDHIEGVRGFLRDAETLHQSLTVYLWLSYRFAGVYRQQALCFHIKSLVEEKIDQCLEEINFIPPKAVRASRYIQRMSDLDQMVKDLQLGSSEEGKEASGEGASDVLEVQEEVEFEEEDGHGESEIAVDVYPADDSPADGNIPQTPESGKNIIPDFVPDEIPEGDRVRDSAIL